MNHQQTILNVLRTEVDEAHEAYLHCESECASAQAAFLRQVDLEAARVSRENAKQHWRSMKLAYDYAIDQFTMNRRHTVKVFDDDDSEPRVYRVPADTEQDARVLAFILDRGLEDAKYGQSSTIDDGEGELAKVYTEIV